PELKRLPFALLDEKQFDEVLRKFTIIGLIDAKCADPWVWCGRGRAFLKSNNPVSAIPDFDRAIYLAPDFAQAYCLRGQAYLTLGNYGRAISETTTAIGLKFNSAPAYFYRASAQYKENNLDLAL